MRIRPVLNLTADKKGEKGKKRGYYYPVYSKSMMIFFRFWCFKIFKIFQIVNKLCKQVIKAIYVTGPHHFYAIQKNTNLSKS